MKVIRPFILLALLLTASRLHAGEWTDLLAETSHGDYYFDFEEEADPEEVFKFEPEGSLLIAGSGQPNGYLQTLEEYANYELEFEWRWREEPGNSGVLIHSSVDTAFGVWPECIEVQLQFDRVGDFILMNTELEVEESQLPESGRHRFRRNRLPAESLYASLESEPKSWNKMRILAEGSSLSVFINDTLVNRGTEAGRRSGYITFQAEGSDLELRGVRLREL